MTVIWCWTHTLSPFQKHPEAGSRTELHLNVELLTIAVEDTGGEAAGVTGELL